MNNFAIARVFSRIGDLMEIQGENSFKIRAYRTAAQVMQELTESLEVLAERGELKSIPGVGDAIADKTREIIATGTCKLYERLKEQVPESLIGLLNLPGFGPKKIQVACKELGVRNLDELEAAARAGKIRGLSGMGAKTEANLILAIEGLRRRRDRTPIHSALAYAEGLVRLLRETGKFAHLEIAGSVRRMQDTVGDIDLAGATNDLDEALKAFVEHAEVAQVLERHPDRATVCTKNDLRVDLRVVGPGDFGSLLVTSTGSVAHLEQLGKLAATRGAELTEGGLYQDNEALEMPEEADFYRFLELPVIPPELREGRGEIEAAQAGRLPHLIQVSDIRGILHAHSTWSDGLAPIARMAEAAQALGFAFHGNTDHSQALTVAGGLNEERLRAQMAEIDALNAHFGGEFRVLKGIECDILADGTLDLPVELLNELDVVIASVHSHGKQDAETITQRVIRALETGVVDILAHPTGRILGMRDPYAVDIERVMEVAKKTGVALEINAAYDRLDLNDLYAREAKNRRIPISINTDAHRPENLAQLRFGISQARRAWLEPEDVINTWSLERLLGWLRHRER